MARAGAQRRWSAFPLAPAAVVVLLRRLRAERELAAVVFGVVRVTSFVFAAVPRLYNEMADDGLTHAVTSSNAFVRNIQMTRAQRIAPSDQPGDIFALVDQEGAEFHEEELAPSIQRIIQQRTYVVDTVRYIVVDPPENPFPSPRYVTLRYQNEQDPHIGLVDGRLPASLPDSVLHEVSYIDAGGQPQVLRVPVYEIAISVETAGQIGVRIGDRLAVIPHSEDGLVRRVPTSEHRMQAVEIVGLFNVPDPTAEYWLGNPQIDRAVEYDDGNMVHFYVTAVMAPDDYARLTRSTPFTFRYQWRYFVDPDAFDAGDLEQISADVRRLETDYSSFTGNTAGETGVRTGLSLIFRRYLGQRELTETILSLASIGLLAVALAVTGLIAAFIVDRRRAAMALVRGRGGSPGQLIGAQFVEGLLYSIPAATIGLLLAMLLVEGRQSVWSLAAAAGIAAATTLLLVAATASPARRSLAVLERADVQVTRVSVRRLVFEGLIIALAVAGAWLLRRRGLAGASSTEDLTEFDPFLAAVPVLVGVATGIVVLRLYPLPVRLFAWLASLRRDLVPVLGFRRVGRTSGASNLPLLVLLLAVAVGVFSSVMLYTIDRGQIETSWQRVGADYRVDSGASGYLSQRLDLAEVDGVEEIAPAWTIPDAVFATRSPAYGTGWLNALDLEAYARVVDGSPAEQRFPAAMRAEPEGDDVGRPSNPIPAIVSRTVVHQQLSPGDTFAMNVLGREVSFFVSETRAAFPGAPVERPFVIAPFRWLESTFSNRTLRSSTLYIRAPAGAGEALEETMRSQTLAAGFLSRHEEYAEIHDSPLIAGVSGGFKVGMAVAAAYAALAIVVALTLTASSRARDLAYLRTLGLSNAQAVGLTVVEQAPLVVVALAAGVALGIASVRLIEPGIDLTVFTGPGIPVELRIDWLVIALLCAALVATVAGAIWATSSIAKRMSLDQTLRVGDE